MTTHAMRPANPWSLSRIFEHFARAGGETCRLCGNEGSDILLSRGEPVHVQCHQRIGETAIQAGIVDVMKNCTQPKARKRRAAMAQGAA